MPYAYANKIFIVFLSLSLLYGCCRCCSFSIRHILRLEIKHPKITRAAIKKAVGESKNRNRSRLRSDRVCVCVPTISAEFTFRLCSHIELNVIKRIFFCSFGCWKMFTMRTSIWPNKQPANLYSAYKHTQTQTYIRMLLRSELETHTRAHVFVCA